MSADGGQGWRYPFESRFRTELTWLVAAVGLFLAGCGSDSLQLPDRVVLVTIDTLRADHVGTYGYPLDITPFIDSLADSGVTFGRALSHASATSPSHASMFTGLYPIQHRVESNGLRLDDEFRTLAEAFREVGFRTAAFTSTNAHFAWGNLHQGFEMYDEQPVIDPDRRERKEVKGLYRPASETIDAALEWLARIDDGDRLFLWIHLYDPHKSLRPPQPYREAVRRLVKEIGENRYRRALKSAHGDPANDRLYRLIRLYDAEILYADSQLERLYRALHTPERTDLWIVTSDHGEGLKSHDGYFGHVKQVYNTQIQVPLIFHYTHGLDEPIRIDDVVATHIDLAPTLAEIVGLDVGQPGSAPQGRSLVPYMAGSAAKSSSRYSLAQSHRQPRWQHHPMRKWPRYSLQSLELKYILQQEGDDELYDLQEDPNEKRNLLESVELSEERESMRNTLVGMVAALTNSDVDAETVDEEALERLRALGYLK